MSTVERQITGPSISTLHARYQSEWLLQEWSMPPAAQPWARTRRASEFRWRMCRGVLPMGECERRARAKAMDFFISKKKLLATDEAALAWLVGTRQLHVTTSNPPIFFSFNRFNWQRPFEWHSWESAERTEENRRLALKGTVSLLAIHFDSIKGIFSKSNHITVKKIESSAQRTTLILSTSKFPVWPASRAVSDQALPRVFR